MIEETRESMEKRIEALEEERDSALEREQALAAHMDRLRTGFDSAVTWEDVREVFSYLPSVSLDHRDLIKQAEALERLIRVMRQPMRDGSQPWLIHVEDATAMADDYRQRAAQISKTGE